MNSTKLDSRRKSTASATHLKVKNILATTDLSNRSFAGVRYAAALGKRISAKVALLYVVELPPPPPRDYLLSGDNSKIPKSARARLNTLATGESRGDAKLTPLIRSGNSIYGILATARERAADLIVIATHGYTGANRVFLGSTAERVVRHAPCSVLTVPARAIRRRTGQMLPFSLTRILVPIDFSECSKAALPWAASVAAEFNAELILLHVVETFAADYLLGPQLANETITPLMKEREAELKRMAESLKESTGLKVSAAVRAGKPFKEIYSASEKLGADLIALTTRGNTGLKRVWLGSTAERVVRHASRPVLIVRERERKKS